MRTTPITNISMRTINIQCSLNHSLEFQSDIASEKQTAIQVEQLLLFLFATTRPWMNEPADDVVIRSAYQISYYAFAGIFVLLFIICTFQLIRVNILYPIVKMYKVYAEWEEWSVRPLFDFSISRAFLLVLPWSCLARAVGFLVYWFVSNAPNVSPARLDRVHMIIYGLPQYMMILVHLLLIFFWYIGCCFF